jgi:hypothetical protein
LIKKKID